MNIQLTTEGGAYILPRARVSGTTPRLVPLTRALLHRALVMERDLETRRATNLLDLRGVLTPGLGVAFVDGSAVLGAGGIAEFDGRVQAWMLVSTAATRPQIAQGVRLARRWLDIKSKTFPRIDLYVRAFAPYRESFTAALGFRDTGNVEPFGRGDLICRYERAA